jgi:hypothetical protein
LKYQNRRELYIINGSTKGTSAWKAVEEEGFINIGAHGSTYKYLHS